MPLNTPTSLLLYLAASADWVSRRELAYLYRPDSGEAEALAYLRLQLHRAARYSWAAELEIGKQQVRWLVPTDLLALRRYHKEGNWAEAVAAYGGAFLSGLEDSGWPTFDSWLELEREACRLQYQEALRAYAGALVEAGNSAGALDAYRRLLAEDELDEPSIRQLMRLSSGLGRTAEAKRQYEQFRQVLARELGLEPEVETTMLAESLAVASRPAGDPGPTATGSARATDTAPGGPSYATPTAAAALPRATTKFIGRGAELAQLAELLGTEDVRLLTLVGIGGTGKTRLATEVARRNARSFGGGVWFVSLVEATHWQGALERMAATLGVEAASTEALEEMLAGHMTEPTLLVLDNCEQVEGLAGLVHRLLTASDKVRLLVTSRRTLDLSLEHIYDVRGLALPGGPQGDGGDDAAQLFLAAARRVLPRLAPTADDMKQVHRICALVDGLPLALELAAAWVRAMPLARIARELELGFELLTTDNVDVARRHRSVDEVLGRTWASLTERKADTLAAMAVFQDGCSLEAAEVVSGGELPILLSLVNQSLLHRSSEGRFGCHPLVAQYSAKALAAKPGLARQASEAHADFFADLLLRFAPDRQGVDAPPLRVLEPDIGNVERAWFYLLREGRTGRLAELVDALFNYYTIIGQYRRGADVGARTLARLPAADSVSARVRCSIWLAQCNMARESGMLLQALESAKAALQEAQTHELADMAAKAQRFSGDVLQMLGRYDEATGAYEHAVAAFSRLAETAELANTLNSLASMDAVREEFESATVRFEECVLLFEQVGDVLAKAIALNNLGYLSDAMGRSDEAARYYEAGLSDFERIQFTRGIAAVKNNLVVLYGTLGRLDEAEAMGIESLKLKSDMEDRLGIVVSLKNLGDICLMRGRPHDAMSRYLPAMKLALQVDALPRLLQVLPGYAKALDLLGRERDALLVRTALARHPLTPPSAKEGARALLPGLDEGDDEAMFTRLVEKLEAELAGVALTY